MDQVSSNQRASDTSQAAASSVQFAAVLRDIAAEQESARTTHRRWQADMQQAKAVCEPDADASAMFAANAIRQIRGMTEADAVVILAALAEHVTDLKMHQTEWRSLLACACDCSNDFMGEVVRQREERAEEARGKRVVIV